MARRWGVPGPESGTSWAAFCGSRFSPISLQLLLALALRAALFCITAPAHSQLRAVRRAGLRAPGRRSINSAPPLFSPSRPHHPICVWSWSVAFCPPSLSTNYSFTLSLCVLSKMGMLGSMLLRPAWMSVHFLSPLPAKLLKVRSVWLWAIRRRWHTFRLVLLLIAVLGFGVGLLRVAASTCDDFRASGRIACAGGLSWPRSWQLPGLLPFRPQLSCTGNSGGSGSGGGASGPFGLLSLPVDGSGCILLPPQDPLLLRGDLEEGVVAPTPPPRVCGLWTLPSGYLGRTGNQMVQMLVQHFLAGCVEYLFADPPEILEGGLSAAVLSSAAGQCPTGYILPQSWLEEMNPATSVISTRNASESLLAAIAAHRQQRRSRSSAPSSLSPPPSLPPLPHTHTLPRILQLSWYWERGDLLTAVAERHPWNREAQAPPLFPARIASAYKSIVSWRAGGKTTAGGSLRGPESSSDYTLATATAALAEDPDSVLVVHIRAGDLAELTLQREFVRRAQARSPASGDAPNVFEPNEWAGVSRRPMSGTPVGDALKAFNEDMNSHPRPGGSPKNFNWDFAKEEYGLDLPELLEQNDCATNDMMTPPLSFFRAVLADGGRAKWRRIFVLTEPGSEEHPIVAAVLREFHATLISIKSVAETLALLMAARHLVLSSSTLSQIGGIFGRAHTLHFPHVGLDSLRPDHHTCRLPLVRSAGGSGASGAGPSSPHGTPVSFREMRGGPRVIYHDVLRACIGTIMETNPERVLNMQRAHGWTQETVTHCFARHPEAARSPYFLNSSQLLAFYRDADCARVFMPTALQTPGEKPHLCVDEYRDWDEVCAGEL